ncbi:MAG: 3-deoxy-D-manno-octulosonic acid transferase [Lautropia sp.]
MTASNDSAWPRRLYSAAWWLAVPFALGYLLYRSVRQPAYRRHWGERFGFGAAPPADSAAAGPTIWIHAVSVGETAAVAPLLWRLAAAYPDARFLLTHATPTGRDTGRERFARLGPRLAQCYLPYDLGAAVARFFATRRPALGLIVETEVWPNLMAAAQASGVPVASINARLSERSLARGLRFRRLIVPAVAAFAAIVAQTATHAARIARLGRRVDAVAGNLKFDQPVVAAQRAQGEAWRARFGSRPIVVAASTRDGEEELLLAAWRAARGALVARPLLIVVPRHPNRFDEVAALLGSAFDADGGVFVRRRALDDPAVDPAAIDCLLGDSMGEMQAWYAAADVAIIGGSLLPFGAQNLIEANALGCPVVLGPSVYNFEDAAAEAIAAGAAQPVADASAAIDAALAIARDRERRAVMSAAALAFTAAHRGAVDRTMAALAPLLLRTLGPPAGD